MGSSGAGKTELGSLAGLPVVHLDRHYWRPGWQEPDRETWVEQVRALIAEPRWVMDGNYSGTLAQRLPAADTIIFLDFPTWLCLWRVLKRTFRSLGQVRPDLAPGCPEKFDLEFLKYVWRYRRKDQPHHLMAIADFPGRLIFLRRPAEIRAFLDDQRSRTARVRGD